MSEIDLYSAPDEFGPAASAATALTTVAISVPSILSITLIGGASPVKPGAAGAGAVVGVGAGAGVAPSIATAFNFVAVVISSGLTALTAFVVCSIVETKEAAFFDGIRDIEAELHTMRKVSPGGRKQY